MDAVTFVLGLVFLFVGLWVWLGVGVALAAVGAILTVVGAVLFNLSRLNPTEGGSDADAR